MKFLIVLSLTKQEQQKQSWILLYSSLAKGYKSLSLMLKTFHCFYENQTKVCKIFLLYVNEGTHAIRLFNSKHLEFTQIAAIVSKSQGLIFCLEITKVSNYCK